MLEIQTGHDRKKFRSQNFRQYGAEKQSRQVESEESRVKRQKIHLRESQKKEDTGPKNVRKVGTCCDFTMICGSCGSKLGSLKQRVRNHVAR